MHFYLLFWFFVLFRIRWPCCFTGPIDYSAVSVLWTAAKIYQIYLFTGFYLTKLIKWQNIEIGKNCMINAIGNNENAVTATNRKHAVRYEQCIILLWRFHFRLIFTIACVIFTSNRRRSFSKKRPDVTHGTSIYFIIVFPSS